MGNIDASGNSVPLHSLFCMTATIQDTPVSVLHDDGSTHDFIYERLALELDLTTVKSSFKVKSAFQGTRYNGISMVTDLPITIGAYTQKRSFLLHPCTPQMLFWAFLFVMSITLTLTTIHTR